MGILEKLRYEGIVKIYVEALVKNNKNEMWVYKDCEEPVWEVHFRIRNCIRKYTPPLCPYNLCGE